MKHLLQGARDTGNRLTGGGLRALVKRALRISLRRVMSQPFLRGLGRVVLKPFPNLSAQLYRIGTLDSAVPAATTATSLPQPRDPALLVNSLYKTALGRLADPKGLANCVQQLRSGASLEALAEGLVASAEFQARHGSTQKVDTEFLNALYRDGLGRKPDPEGFANWLAEAEKGATWAKVLAGLAGSDEALRAVATLLVNSLYQTALGRLADETGFANCVRQLLSNISLEALSEEVVASAEFQARHGSSQTVDKEYLTALYRDGLGREPDPEGLASWLAEGRNGATRANMLAAFAGSNEALQRVLALANLPQIDNPGLLVNSLYKTAFGRPADPAGLANGVRQLQSGISLEVLAEQIAASGEFQARHGSGRSLDIKYLTALYWDGLGRQPDLKSLAHWLAEGKKGATRAKALAAFAASDEAREELLPSKLDSRTAYRRWVALNDTISDVDRGAIRAHIAGLPFRPVISVIMPIGKTSEAALCKSFDSVVTQLYPYWELCIAVGSNTERLWTAILRERAVRDSRIRLTQKSTVEDCAAATNAAFELAAGEFVAFLQPGDVLPENSLYEVAIEFSASPPPDIVYSDHDQIDADGQRVNPWFKPGWDPDLLVAQDYISNLAVYRRTLVEEIGFLRPSFEGAEFHDLALRATAAIAPDRIRHLPAILYHRSSENETNHSKNALPVLRATTARHHAVRDHLDCRGDANTVLKPAPQIPSAIRIIWPLPAPEPLVSVIILTRDRADLLARCVDGLLHRTDYCDLELLIVDSGSSEPATLNLFYRLAHEESRVRILRQSGPLNYSALTNAAAREAKGEVLLLLNNDIEVIDAGWLRELVSQAVRPDVGIVGTKLLYADEQVQHGGIVLGPNGRVNHVHRFASRNDPGYRGQLALTRTLSAVTGACVAIRRAVFFEVGGFDEVNLPAVFNDVDLCLRLGDYGYRVVWTPFAELFHFETASHGLEGDDSAKHEWGHGEWQHLRKTWGSLLESADPFHNPNLIFHSNHCEIPSSSRRSKPWHHVVEQASTWNVETSTQ